VWTTDELGFDSRWGRAVASPQHSIQTGSGTDLGNRVAFYLGVKRRGSGADHSPPSSAEVRMRGIKPPVQERPCSLGTALRPVDSCSLSLYKAELQLFFFKSKSASFTKQAPF
jgi:hypothetical protein